LPIKHLMANGVSRAPAQEIVHGDKRRLTTMEPPQARSSSAKCGLDPSTGHGVVGRPAEGTLVPQSWAAVSSDED
jgi:hypothetical protein